MWQHLGHCVVEAFPTIVGAKVITGSVALVGSMHTVCRTSDFGGAAGIAFRQLGVGAAPHGF